MEEEGEVGGLETNYHRAPGRGRSPPCLEPRDALAMPGDASGAARTRVTNSVTVVVVVVGPTARRQGGAGQGSCASRALDKDSGQRVREEWRFERNAPRPPTDHP